MHRVTFLFLKATLPFIYYPIRLRSSTIALYVKFLRSASIPVLITVNCAERTIFPGVPTLCEFGLPRVGGILVEELMLETERSPQGVSSPFVGDDSAEEELSVLPRHTKVIVTGNNRTKSVLVGLHGIVKKAVGLGGWHWLVLTNGLEVKLQRNALSVLEAPTGQEEDDDSEDLLSNKSNLEDFPKPFKSRVRPQQRPAALSKAVNRSHAADMPATGLKSRSTGVLKVDFSKLETTALRRYC
eukprot:c27335_g1_i3 orf=1688-2413(-)